MRYENHAQHLLESIPLLSDESFVRMHPGVLEVVALLDLNADYARRTNRSYRPFVEASVEDTAGFVDALRSGNSAANQVYGAIQGLFSFDTSR